jgi:hypothetical protein
VQDLESLKELSDSPGWETFKELVLDFLGTQWAKRLESEDDPNKIRLHQGGIRFYREVLACLERFIYETLEEARQELKEAKNG